MRVLFVVLCACGRVGFDTTASTSNARTDAAPPPPDASACVALDLGAAFDDGGFAYVVYGQVGAFGVADTEFGDASTLRLFEDTRELGPAHTTHDDIRNLGLGRFSHWTATDNTSDSIHFSASDNSDPRTNLRSYKYCPN